MVLGVCRRALPTVQDAEDAAQATFLVLARKVRGTRWQPSVANWLYATARRVAAKAARTAGRRARREARAARPPEPSLLDRMTGREAFTALDEELDRLPARYRGPLLLCYLEGLTRDQAAARLGVPPATLKSQLDRGRKRLGDALTRRGVSLGAGLLAIAATSPAGASPPRLAQAVLAAVSGSPPAAVAVLAKGAAMNGVLKNVMMGLVAVAAVTIGVGVGWPSPDAAGRPPEPEAAAVKADGGPDAAPPGDARTYRGRVLGPDGRPVPGAKLYLTPWQGYLKQPYPSSEIATTGPDGRFEFTAPKDKRLGQGTFLTAAAADHGAAWAQLRAGDKRDDLTLRLVADDVPVTGQVVDLEGKPVAGATLLLMQINAAPGEDLGPFLEAVKARKGRRLQLQQQYLSRYTVAPPLTVTTDAAGRFRLTGVGRNRLVTLRLDGPTVVSQDLHVLTRPGKPFTVTEYEGHREYGDPRSTTTYYGAEFRHAAAPARPIVGVVRDRDTRKPLAGATVQSYKLANSPYHGADVVQVVTDAEGRYRLSGMPKGEGNKIVVVPPRDRPYVAVHTGVPDTPGLDPVTVDVELRRGVWIEGRITDKASGRPVRAAVEYFALEANPNLPDYPGFDGTILMDSLGAGTNEDGSYRVAGLPGPGLVAVWYKGNYLRAPERDDEYGLKEPFLRTAPYHLFHPVNCGALARVDPAKGVGSVRRDVTLDPGWTFTGKVLGPDGKPLAGARGFAVTGRLPPWDRAGMRSAEFTVRGFNPQRPRDVLLQHPERGLVGVVQPPKENGGSVTVRMEPGAAITGRLVGADGKPRAGVELELSFRPKKVRRPDWEEYPPERIETDREGRFRVGPLLPGYEFRLSGDGGALDLGGDLRSGQTKDLGDVQLKRTGE
jgi:RNA polymerase sigma factor (sigma-70 family)